MTGVYGSSERIPKTDMLYEALGTVDELCAVLGVCKARARADSESLVASAVEDVQQKLFIVQASLARAPHTIDHNHVELLERMIDRIGSRIEKPDSFIVPGASELSGLFDMARAVARRAERAVLRVDPPVSRETKAYLNRLSTFLYVCARYTAHASGAHEVAPTYQ